jgi:hypothetical protein
VAAAAAAVEAAKKPEPASGSAPRPGGSWHESGVERVGELKGSQVAEPQQDAVDQGDVPSAAPAPPSPESLPAPAAPKRIGSAGRYVFLGAAVLAVVAVAIAFLSQHR